MATRRRPALWPLAVLVALLVGFPIAGWVDDALESELAPQGITGTVTAYRAVYRVDNLAGGGAAVSTERVWVRRPFGGRVEVREGPPPGDAVVTTIVSGFALRQRGSGGEAPFVLAVEPAPPEGDLRLDGALDDAVPRALLTFREERRRVLGRRCDVYRSPLLSPTGREEGDFRELCIDAAGLILAEEQTAGGKVLRRRRAVSLELEPDLDDDLFAAAGEPVDVDEGGGALRKLTPASRVADATVYELASGPEGFEHLGRYALTPASPITEGLVPGGFRIVGVVDAWVKGPDFVAVFNGGTEDESEPFGGDRRARRADLGAPGRGETVVSLSGAEARVDLGEGRFVRVFGTLSVDRLIALARQLEPRTGGSITPLEPPRS